MGWLIKLIFDKIAKVLDGKKMYIIGTAAILKGLLGLIGTYWPDTGVPAEDVSVCVNEILAGVAMFAGKSAIVKVGDNCESER